MTQPSMHYFVLGSHHHEIARMVDSLQVGKFVEALGGCHTAHIIELATHKQLLVKKVGEILHNSDFESYMIKRPYLQVPDTA
eukprot:15019682-Heterocapsa_arctica.AAC.1